MDDFTVEFWRIRSRNCQILPNPMKFFRKLWISDVKDFTQAIHETSSEPTEFHVPGSPAGVKFIFFRRLTLWWDEMQIPYSIINDCQTKTKEKIDFSIYALISLSLSSIWRRASQMWNFIRKIGGAICYCLHYRDW